MGSLAALAAVAFAFGAGLGLLWKDPGLLLAQWAGDTQEVAWTQAPTRAADELLGAESGPLPAVEVPSRVATDAPREARQKPVSGAEGSYQTASAEPARPIAEPTPTRAAAPRPEAPPHEVTRAPATPAVSAPPPRGVAVQVGAFADRHAADQLIARLESAGFDAYAAPAEGGAWRVRVGPFRDRNGAEQAALRLKQEQKLPTWVLEETGSR